MTNASLGATEKG